MSGTPSPMTKPSGRELAAENKEKVMRKLLGLIALGALS